MLSGGTCLPIGLRTYIPIILTYQFHGNSISLNFKIISFNWRNNTLPVNNQRF